jgi:hypothetical protein
MRKLNWRLADVGCYWSAGDGFHIHTRTSHGQSGRSACYVLHKDFTELGTYQTLNEAQNSGNIASGNAQLRRE